MKPEIGDKVLVKDYFGEKEGIVFRLPSRDSYYQIGCEIGSPVYAEEHKITVLFRPEYHYINQNPFKVGDLVTWAGERCLVVGLEEGEYNCRILELSRPGTSTFVKEQDLVLVHAAGHPEEKVSAPEVEPEGWYGYPPLEQPEPPGWDLASEAPTFTEADDDVLPF